MRRSACITWACTGKLASTQHQLVALVVQRRTLQASHARPRTWSVGRLASGGRMAQSGWRKPYPGFTCSTLRWPRVMAAGG